MTVTHPSQVLLINLYNKYAMLQMRLTQQVGLQKDF